MHRRIAWRLSSGGHIYAPAAQRHKHMYIMCYDGGITCCSSTTSADLQVQQSLEDAMTLTCKRDPTDDYVYCEEPSPCVAVMNVLCLLTGGEHRNTSCHAEFYAGMHHAECTIMCLQLAMIFVDIYKYTSHGMHGNLQVNLHGQHHCWATLHVK